jgi:hypothetical protein
MLRVVQSLLLSLMLLAASNTIAFAQGSASVQPIDGRALFIATQGTAQRLDADMVLSQECLVQSLLDISGLESSASISKDKAKAAFLVDIFQARTVVLLYGGNRVPEQFAWVGSVLNDNRGEAPTVRAEALRHAIPASLANQFSSPNLIEQRQRTCNDRVDIAMGSDRAVFDQAIEMMTKMNTGQN